MNIWPKITIVTILLNLTLKLVTMCGYYREILKLHILLTSLITITLVPSKSWIHMGNLLSFSNSLHPFLDFTPVFHVSLLEPFIDPNNIPNHISEPIAHNIEIPEEPNIQISTIVDSRKVGRCYNYFVHWINTTDTKNFWIPFSNIPNSLFHILDQIHCRNPSRPHPPRFLFSTNSVPPTSLKSFPSNHAHSHYQPTHSPSPPPEPSFHDYQLPVQQVTRSG